MPSRATKWLRWKSRSISKLEVKPRSGTKLYDRISNHPDYAASAPAVSRRIDSGSRGEPHLAWPSGRDSHARAAGNPGIRSTFARLRDGAALALLEASLAVGFSPFLRGCPGNTGAGQRRNRT